MSRRRGMVREGGALALLIALVAACGNEVVIVSPSGTGSGGDGATTTLVAASSSTGAGARVIPVTLDSGPAYLEDGVVFQSHADGSLVASWSPTELPVMATVVDGDVITFAHVDADQFYHSYFESKRITPVVSEVHGVWPAGNGFPPPSCELDAPTHVIVHVPAVPGAEHVRISGARTGFAMEYALPADVELDVAVCPGEKLSLFATAFAAGDYDVCLASQLWEGLEPAPNGTIELTPTFDGAPRKALPIEVTGIDPGGSVWGTAHWSGVWTLSPLMYDGEQHQETVSGVASFLYAPEIFDLPNGFAVAVLNSVRPNPEGACYATSTFDRFGASDLPLQYDVSGLAQPARDGASWKLGPGSIGDSVALRYSQEGYAHWTFTEDPHFSPFPAVLPALPPLPAKLHAPSASLPLESIVHFVESGAMEADPGVQWTGISQSVSYTGCP